MISFYEGVEFEGSALKGSRGGETYLIQDDQAVLEFFQSQYKAGGSVGEKAKRLATSVLSNSAWWGEDLTGIDGLTALVESYLTAIWTVGMKSAIKEVV